MFEIVMIMVDLKDELLGQYQPLEGVQHYWHCHRANNVCYWKRVTEVGYTLPVKLRPNL